VFNYLKISLLLLILTTIFSSSTRAECPPGDLDDNCRVNLEDLRIFAEQWLSKESTQANLDGMGGINAYDYAILAEDWLKRGIPLRINEFMASNNSVYEDPDNPGEYSDWIEIYNAGDEAIDMSGMYITDNLNNPTQWQIPGGVILDDDDYLVILADLLDYQGAALHTNFKLGAGGEQIGLFHSNGTTEIDSIDFDQVEQYTDISYGLDANDTLRFFGIPTPDAQNNDAYLGLVADTTFSRDRGFYDTSFSVELECETPGADIYYSVDFSKPDQVTGTEYTGPISVTQTTSIRAMAFKPGWKPTNVDTHTYIFLDNVANQNTAQAVARGFPDPWDMIQEEGWPFFPDPPYTMDDVPSYYDVDSTLNGSVADFKQQLKAIPTMSIVTEMDDMWKWDQGYYVNSWIHGGVVWEREASVEYFDATGNEEFQINCGIRAQGNQNRKTGPDRTPKHSMRLRFKNDYGPSKLRYPLFKDSDVDTFDSITLRGGCADSWHQYGAGRASYTRDAWAHRSMHEVGQYAPHGNYVHLYLNGLYWGLYNPVERPDASFYAEHVGIGEREEWEANNQGDPMGDDTPADLVVWNTIAGMCTGTFLSTTFNDTQYDDLSEWLDMTSLCDYLLVNFYSGCADWGKWNFYAGALPGEPGQPPLIKLRFSTWDAEESIGLWGPPWDSTGPCLGHDCPNPEDDRGVIRIYSRLMGNAKFQALFGDRAYKWLYNGAPLDNQNCIDRWLGLAAEIWDAIAGESARWGDVDGLGATQSSWQWWMGDIADGFFFGSRRDTVIGQLRSRDLYPSIDPPIYSQHGGYVSAGYSLTMTNPNGSGTIYYTLDGSEPRDSGTVYSGAITLNESTLVKARVLKSSEWSALNEVAFGIGPIADNLRITEMMYHPADAPLGDPNAEFVEVKNVGGTALKLNLVKFTEGIHFTFPSMTLGAGDYAIVVKDAMVFTAEYPTFSGVIAGEYIGSLDNGGERVRLEDAVGGTVLDFRYNDGWRPITDGVGYSLTVMDETETDPSMWNDKQGWDAGTYIGGTPGEFDDGPRTGDIVINEVLAHSNYPPGDWIELHNTTASPIDITGWFLSDSDANLLKYEIPSTSIPANGYVVFTEDDHFGGEFALSENGETVYLTSGFDGYGHLTGYRRTEDFDASEGDISFGRYEKSDGTHNFVAMASQTRGSVNSGPKVGPVVINEIMYHPDIVGTAEFVELYNITGSTVPLYEYDSGVGQNIPWKFTDDGGIDCNMPPGTNIPAGGYLLLVRDLVDFEAEYSAPGGIQRVEWPLGKLSNAGEKLEIAMPGDRNELTGERYYIRIDRVVYSDGFHPEGEDPWPTEPDGQNGDGSSLHRKVPGNYGNDVINWEALAPTPGT